MRMHLRGMPDDDAIRPWLPADEWEQAAHARNRPNALCRHIEIDLRESMHDPAAPPHIR